MHPLAAQPGLCLGNQGFGRCLVFRFKQPPIACARTHPLFGWLAKRKMVNMRGNATDDPPVAFGKIELRLAMLEPGILARRYEAMDFILQWRDPVRVACVQALGQVDKRIPVGFGCDRANQG